MKKVISGCILLFSSLASALNVDIQRDVFSEVLTLQEKQKWQKANQQVEKIEDYPLAYLAQFNYLNANLTQVEDKQIRDFIIANKGKAASDDLQRSYLFMLAEQKRWADFLTAYPKLPNTPELQCYYLTAAIKTGKSEQVWQDAKEIWLKSSSLPSACDEVYQFYQAQKKLTQTLIWQRFELAYEKNKAGLMRFLIKKMDKQNARLAQQLYQIQQKPQKLLTTKLFSSREAKSFALLVPSIKHLARKDIKKAKQAYARFEKKTPFTFNETVEINTRFATVILQNNKQQYLTWLDKELASLGSVSLIEQRIRYAIKRNDWKAINTWIAHLPEQERNKSVWLYWQARILERQGESKQAQEIYKKVAVSRNYYGFLSAQKLGKSYPLNEEKLAEERGSLRFLMDELALIHELQFHGLNQQAKRQWRRLLNANTFYLQQQLGIYAYSQGWAHLSVLASISSKSWNALDIRFPSAESEIFSEQAKKYDLEETYLYAITRRESSFDINARSPVGARGYMQLMPRTAQEVARKIGLSESEKNLDLKDGSINIQLGSAYFNSLLKRYDGNRVLATAAYNAGPHRVNKWVNTDKELAMDSWVESIPFYETRTYVKNILVYNVIYQHKLDKPLQFIKEQELSGSY